MTALALQRAIEQYTAQYFANASVMGEDTSPLRVALRERRLAVALELAADALEYEWYGHMGGVGDPFCDAPKSLDREHWREQLIGALRDAS